MDCKASYIKLHWRLSNSEWEIEGVERGAEWRRKDINEPNKIIKEKYRRDNERPNRGTKRNFHWMNDLILIYLNH